MIETRHQRWAHFIFRSYLHRLFRRNFHSIHLLGEIPEHRTDQPVLLLPNHSSWWDGFFIYLVNQKIFKRPIYLMMLESQLKNYPFFTRVGAFSIDPQRPKSVMSSLNYSRKLLDLPVSPAPLVCLFPQGELRPNFVRPLGLENGYKWIVSKVTKPLTIITLGIRIEFLDHQLPEVFFQFGKVATGDIQETASKNMVEKSLCGLLDSIHQEILSGDKGTSIITGSSSINDKWDSFVRTRLRKRGN
jgi:1-acyl-sn-glycerol-3-phosphate acyltransferase